MEPVYLTRPSLPGYPHLSVESIRDEPRMVGGERQRAYRYGMTLLCVGALFNWLGMNDSSNSDPIRFIGYTCLASGALLICMAICFWATADSGVNRSRPINQVVPSRGQQEMVVSIIQEGRVHREKPPDYDTVAAMSPPPSYDDAIRLSPSHLPTTSQSRAGNVPDLAPEYSVICTVVDETSQNSTEGESSENISAADNNKLRTDSALTRVFRLSSRFLKRSLSNVDRRLEETEAPPIRRTSSVQDMKNA